MREPGFWHGPASLNSHLLRPLGALYGAVAARRLQRRGLNAGIPVLCVGNYHVGGAGKTPTVLALAKLLARTRRDAGRAQPRLWRKIARAGQGRSDQACGFRCRRRAADAGRHAAGGGVAQARGRRAAGACARRDRDPDGRRLPEPGGRQGCVADRDRRRRAASATDRCFPPAPCARRCGRNWRAPMR